MSCLIRTTKRKSVGGEMQPILFWIMGIAILTATLFSIWNPERLSVSLVIGVLVISLIIGFLVFRLPRK